jgi:hypothetical protein
MAKFAGLRDPVTFDFENSTFAYCVDAFSISLGALLGVSPVTAFIESATGISGAFSCSFENCRCLIFRDYRGWQDGFNGHHDWNYVFCVHILCSHLCVHPILGHRWCVNHRWITDDPQVRAYLYLRNHCLIFPPLKRH